ncbi:MAG: aspartate aminotransferase family protein [Opitutae bacterium]|nr:aspartate aminotransferase family protein [Opitutae bacterium]
MNKFTRKYSIKPVKVPQVKTKHRRIVTALPVPQSLPTLRKLEKHEPMSMQGQPPIVMHKAEGNYVWDNWGNQWIDWSSGVLISNAGNANKAVAKALKEMIQRPLLSTYVFPHEKRAELAELLASIAPDKSYKVFLLSTGSEATENCIKLSKTYALQKYGPEKRYFVSFKNAFHGRTMGAQLAGGNPNLKKWLGKSDDSFVQVPFPDGYKNTDTRFELFLETLAGLGIKPEQVCGVMTESFQGVGPDFMPVEYARKLAAWCRANDVVLTMDEVQAGFGRSGKWFSFQHYGIKPDLIACGKGISSSLALSAVIGRPEVMELYAPGSMTSTHSASPLPVAAAIANIRELKRSKAVQNAAKLEPVLHKGLLAIQKKHPAVAGCVQCRGLVAGIQIVKPGTKEPDSATAIKINEKCFHKGLLMFAPVGIAGECIKIAPSLLTSKEVLLEGLAVLDAAMDEVLG